MFQLRRSVQLALCIQTKRSVINELFVVIDLVDRTEFVLI